MTVNLSALGGAGQQFFDNNGVILSGGKLYSYAAGTTTPQTTYTSASGNVAHTNPIILDSSGRVATGEIWLTAGSNYKFILKTSSDVTIATWDNITGINGTGITSDATNVNYTPPFAGSVSETVSEKLAQSVSVKDFGAVGNGIADDTLKIQAAIDFVKGIGGSVFLPTGTYKITDTIVIDTSDYSVGVILYGDGRNTVISQTAAGKDAIHFSTTQFLQNSGLRDLKIVCDSDAGHCINIVYGCTTCFISNVDLEQSNPNKSVLYGDYTVFGGGVYDTKFSGGSWYCATNSAASGVRFIAKGTIFNENIFENIRCYNSTTAQFFKITTVTDVNIWLVNNSWKNINFEICKGGGIAFDSFKNCSFQNISFWDAGGTYTNNLIDLISGAGYESAANTFINVGRNGDSLSGCKDIRIVSGQDTALINCYTQLGDSPEYDLGNKRVLSIGKLFGVVTNTVGFTSLNDIDGLRFGGTENGAPLSYYDEGTWTATLTGSTASPSSPITTPAKWTRIGRKVFVEGVFSDANMTGSTGSVRITGLPFAVGNVSATGSCCLLSLGTSAAVPIALSGETQIGFYNITNVSSAIPVGTTSVYVYFSLSYSV